MTQINVSSGNNNNAIIRCYKCGSTQGLKPCGSCRKYMCTDCRKKYWDRLHDFASEKIHGYSRDWYKEGKI